ncbi:helix-turn-helix transcriptional regulator [Kribbella solani]|uniref:helix-turn-helix domain-containing protein n=1 Tax=Kribbella solani TaxID=236067 RepID=UPI0029BF9095|nr:helix-turn-helix transcriptional regulator [Kribbella solani]MDX3004488.1 helix-turn-helix transcriptional regulator [Kribbella solani]
MPEAQFSSAQSAHHALANRLQEIRLDAGMTARALSAAAGWHEAKTSRIEHAKQRPTENDVRAWCYVCTVPKLTPELIAELRAVNSMWLDWRRAEQNGLKQINVAVRDIYERTRRFRSYCQSMIPGLLQTSEYTTAVLTSVRERRKVAVDDIAAAVEERVERQHILREGDHTFAFVLEEATLRYQVGGYAVLADQLRHLLDSSRLPSITLGVIPATVDRSARWPVEDFYVFDNAQANVELVSGFLTITHPREVAMYAETFAALSSLAVYGAAARRLITGALAELPS